MLLTTNFVKLQANTLVVYKANNTSSLSCKFFTRKNCVKHLNFKHFKRVLNEVYLENCIICR